MHENEKRLTAALIGFLDQYPDTVGIMDANGTIVHTNQAFRDLFGYGTGSFLPDPRSLIEGGSDVRRALSLFKEVLQGASGNLDLRMPCAHGGSVIVNWTASPIAGEKGEPNVLCVGRVPSRATDQSHERTGLQTVISKVSRLLSSTKADLDAVLELLGTSVNANRAYVFRFRDDLTLMDNTHEWCKEGTVPQIDNLRDIPTDSVWWWMGDLRANRAIAINDVNSMPELAESERAFLVAQGIRALLVVPVSVGDKLLGLLGFDDTENPRAWGVDETELLRTAAEALASYLDREASRKDLAKSRGHYLSLLGDFPTLMWTTDADGRVDYISKGWSAFTDETDVASFDSHWADMLHPDDAHRVTSTYNASLKTRRPFEIEYRLRRRDGAYRWILEMARPSHSMEGDFQGYVGSCFDYTERKENEDLMGFLAYNDPMTRLPNRVRTESVLTDELAVCAGNGEPLTVAYLDLDNLKFVNDTMGHAAGDAFIMHVTGCLLSLMGDRDAVGRLSGDEFLIVMPGTDAPRAMDRIRGISDSLRQPFALANKVVQGQGSFGLASYPRDGADAATLMRRADTAMYYTKKHSKGQATMFQPWMDREASEYYDWIAEIGSALDNGHFKVFYQPQYDSDSGGVIGIEALIRWFHPIKGAVSPASFIPIAENTGQVIPIGEWVLEKACRETKEWLGGQEQGTILAVNLSVAQLRTVDFPQRVMGILERTGFDPNRLEMEITENIALIHEGIVPDNIRALKAMGIRISLDDFGTGASSLTCLSRFPVDRIKIAQLFVSGVPGSTTDSAITASIVTMARNLGVDIIAEGVEEGEQLEFLRRNGCTCIQGYYYAKPQAWGDLLGSLPKGIGDGTPARG